MCTTTPPGALPGRLFHLTDSITAQTPALFPELRPTKTIEGATKLVSALTLLEIATAKENRDYDILRGQCDVGYCAWREYNCHRTNTAPSWKDEHERAQRAIFRFLVIPQNQSARKNVNDVPARPTPLPVTET